ncbi:MAG: pilin [Patescibacteria group bacterium]
MQIHKHITRVGGRIAAGTALFVMNVASAFAAPPAGSLAPDMANANTLGRNFASYATFDPTIVNVSDLAARGINFVLGLLGIIAVILILVSGWQWMTAESEDKVKEARKRLVNSVIGLAIIALAWVIGWAIINTLATVTK